MKVKSSQGTPFLLLLASLLFSFGAQPQTSTAAASSAAAVAPNNPTQMPAVALEGVHVVPMTRTGVAVLRDQTVLIRAGRIVQIGPSEEVKVSADTQRVAGEGRYLIPGLADMHVHLERFADPEILSTFVANGVTTVRNMDGRPYIIQWREGAASGALLGPRIITAGPILEGKRAFWDDTQVVASPEEATRIVREQHDVGYDFIKVYHTLAPDAYHSVLAAADSLDLQVAGHAPNGLSFADLVAGGQDSIEHLDGYLDVLEAPTSPFHGRWDWRKLYFAVPIDSGKLSEIAEQTVAAGLWNCPTLVTKSWLGPLPSVKAKLRDPRIADLPDDIVAAWQPRNFPRLRRLNDDDLEALALGERNRSRLVLALAESGAGILVGTDTPNPFVFPGAAVHDELALLVEAGLSALEALASATRSAAEFLGEESEWGTIQPGLRADLVLLDGNPLHDIANTSRVAGVVLNGRWLPPAKLASK